MEGVQVIDDVFIEMATVLDELARVKCRGLEGLHKIKIQSPACSHYLHTKSKHHNLLRNFWEPERAPATLSKVNSKADLSFIYNREFYEKEAKIGKDDPRYECHKHGIYIDLEKAELFSGLFPELYEKEYKAGSIDFDGINTQSKHRAVSFQVDDAAEPIEESEQFEKEYKAGSIDFDGINTQSKHRTVSFQVDDAAEPIEESEEFEKPHVDLNEIIEIAKQNFTKEDLMEYKAGSIDFDGINTQSKHRAVSFQVDDAAEPIEESEQFEKPHVDLNEIIEIAEQNFTKEDLMEYQAGSIDFDGINTQSKHRAVSFQVDDAAEPIEESEQFEKPHVDLNEIIEIAKQNFIKEDLMEYKAGAIDFDGINTQSKHRAVSFQVDDAAEPIEESEQFEKPHVDLNEIIEIAKQNFIKEDLMEYKAGAIDFDGINTQSKHRAVSFQADDAAEPIEESEQFEKPHADLNEIIEIAKQNFTKEDLMGLHTVCNNLDDLPYEEESQLKQSISNETVTSEIDKLLTEKESEMMPLDHTDHNFKWLSINEEEEKSPTEPEDITYGWIISPKSYASYIEGNSDQVSTMDIDNVENEFEDVSEVAKFLVENVLTEAQIIVSSWEKGLGMEATKAKKIQDATESVDVIAGENTSQLSLLTSKDKSDMKMETLCEWEPDRMKIGGSNSHRRRSNPDIFYEFCPLPIYYKVTRSESILGTAIEATEDMYRYVPLSRSLNELFTDSF